MSWIQIWKKSKRFYGWRNIQRACESLCVKYDHPLPERIIALARGGLVPATIIASKLGVRHIHSLGLASYDYHLDGTESPGEFDLYQRLPANTTRLDYDKTVLLIDDISDRGNTFSYAKNYVKEMIGGTVVTMSIILKPKSKFVPDYYHELVDQDKWVVFPWER